MLQAERDDWNVSYELGDTWKNARKIKLKNSSLFKIDILVYPEFSFKNVIITQIYQILFDSLLPFQNLIVHKLTKIKLL